MLECRVIINSRALCTLGNVNKFQTSLGHSSIKFNI